MYASIAQDSDVYVLVEKSPKTFPINKFIFATLEKASGIIH